MTPKKPTPRKTTKPAQKPESEASTKPVPISLDAIMLDGKTQSRVRTDPEVVERYAEVWRNGGGFPPVDLFTEDGKLYYIGDGITRCQGAEKAKRSSVPAIVHQGTEHDAHVFACGSNNTHGVPMTTADKRNAIGKMLELEPTWSNSRIAKHVHVGDQLVADVRRIKEEKKEIEPTKVRTGVDGKKYEAPKSTRQNKAKKDQVRDSRTCEEDDFDPASIESDESGIDIDALADPFRRLVNDINRGIRELKQRAEDEKHGAYLVDKIVRLVKQGEDWKSDIRMMEPVALCPDCVGGCKKCANTGHITRLMAESKKSK